MKEKELLSKLEDLLNEKYEPILVVQLLRVPPQEELQAFAKGLSEQFGYKVMGDLRHGTGQGVGRQKGKGRR